MAQDLYKNKDLVEVYSKIRLQYSQQIADHVLKKMKQNSGSEPKFDLMVEVGCGGGQATNIFAPFFNKVLASDVSAEQIKVAKHRSKFQHVAYDLGKAEEIKVEDGSVDLLLAAEAAHWFDLKKRGSQSPQKGWHIGSFRLWFARHGSPRLNENLVMHSKTFIRSLFDAVVLEHSTDRGKMQHEVKYMYPNIYNRIPTDDKSRFIVTQTYENWTLATAKGMLRSMSFYSKYMKKQSEDIFANKGQVTEDDIRKLDVAEQFGETLKNKFNVPTLCDHEINMSAVYEIFIIVATNLKPQTM